MRRFLLTVATAASALAITSCGDITGVGNVTGAYELQTINGQFLPVTVDDPAAGTIVIVGGEIILDSDETFSDLVDYRFPGSSQIQSQPVFGTYTRSGNTITFFPDNGGDYRMTVSSNGRLVGTTNDGLRLVYQR
jgi:hypothetical protein